MVNFLLFGLILLPDANKKCELTKNYLTLLTF